MMSDLLIYGVIGILTFAIGLLAGYVATTVYHRRRFILVAEGCRDADSIEPLIDELERES
ncbi:MAG: hypothetical protein QCH35_10590 [Methanomicrobiaceae archaeon]|nr:hypothetical protein [Methanomicrobiaceae archaeon]